MPGGSSQNKDVGEAEWVRVARGDIKKEKDAKTAEAKTMLLFPESAKWSIRFNNKKNVNSAKDKYQARNGLYDKR